MDLAHFGLTRRPFRPTPDTEAYFPSASHEYALAALNRGLAERDGLALVTGEPGTGKTLLALKFLEGLPAGMPRILLPAARFARPAELYQAILFDLAVEYRGLSEHELRLAVTDQLLARLGEGSPTVIVLDEAQHLGPEVLEEIRLLGNLETRSAKAAFIVLVGLPSLRERLGQPALAPLAQRVAVRCHLEPLTPEECAGFLRKQLRAAGGRAESLFTEEALTMLAAQGKGLPRLLNQAASLALALAGTARADEVDAEAVMEALTQLGLAPEEPAVIPHPARPAKRRPLKRKSA